MSAIDITKTANAVSCLAQSAKVALSFVFTGAVRYFSVLRFYFYYFFMPQGNRLKEIVLQ